LFPEKEDLSLCPTVKHIQAHDLYASYSFVLEQNRSEENMLKAEPLCGICGYNSQHVMSLLFFLLPVGISYFSCGAVYAASWTSHIHLQPNLTPTPIDATSSSPCSTLLSASSLTLPARGYTYCLSTSSSHSISSLLFLDCMPHIVPSALLPYSFMHDPTSLTTLRSKTNLGMCQLDLLKTHSVFRPISSYKIWPLDHLQQCPWFPIS
jgi:hypothetical protein